ncbi:iron-sulfur cluster assembly accessory protein [Halobacteriales archaeon QS_8_69_73]|nr:MAG: iron-sulfur cluster assembly accessory protein [Halobacteriales archaeon QS_4_69_225]PSQ15589.1 MAG: iron-sulfur cluster assembly accessory protein [Halobacteriales archaeon QS_8_69_73]
MSQTADPDGDPGDPVVVTETAAEQALELIDQEGYDPDEAGLRLFVKQGGCAGLSYGLRFDLEPEEDDAVTTHHGLRVFVDPASQNYVDGSRLEFEGGLQGAGFHVDNPNVESECGCGESFRT